MPALAVAIERYPIAGAFTISRGSRTEALVVTATIADGVHAGRGECVPYARYGETVEGVAASVEAMAGFVAGGGDRAALLRAMRPGAARNALDAALWDLEAKRTGRRAWDLAGLPEPLPAVTCYTLSLGSPDVMHQAARAASSRPLLKVKLGGEGDPERIAAVREGAPGSRLVVDANEAWRPANLEANLAACAAAGVELVEQPLPAGDDAALEGLASPITLCADESVHTGGDLDAIARRYGAVNVKLDKTGGLTEALAFTAAAKARGLRLMVGCMLGTSLAMAPATLLTAGADWVDLDGPLLLARDREHPLSFASDRVHPPEPALWG
jgi:L-alanine-DL-glutamate epimerase-like enolase superfamily enzyme